VKKNKLKFRTLFITFADGNQEFREAGERLAIQASKMNIFTKSIYLNDAEFRIVDNEWRETALELERLSLLPYYYLGTKAWLVNAALEGRFGDFDLVFYADAGCEFLNNVITRKKIRELLNLAYANGGLAEQLNYPEEEYTKKGLVEFFDLTKAELSSGQIQATWSIWKNCNQSKILAKKWVELSSPYLNLWHNQDGLEKLEQSSKFIDHRRDQSIFSILWKRSEYLSKPPYWEYGGRFGVVRGSSVPIHAIRNRNGNSKLKKVQETFIFGTIAVILNSFATLLRKIKYISFK
jgi:hypothetical protein